MMFGWSWSQNKWRIRVSSCVIVGKIEGTDEQTYEDFENVDFINESRIIFELFLLNCLDGVLFMALTVLGQVYNAETTIG